MKKCVRSHEQVREKVCEKVRETCLRLGGAFAFVRIGPVRKAPSDSIGLGTLFLRRQYLRQHFDLGGSPRAAWGSLEMHLLLLRAGRKAQFLILFFDLLKG